MITQDGTQHVISKRYHINDDYGHEITAHKMGNRHVISHKYHVHDGYYSRVRTFWFSFNALVFLSNGTNRLDDTHSKVNVTFKVRVMPRQLQCNNIS